MLGNPDTWDWVVTDPVVSCFAPALFFLDQDGHIVLSENFRQTTKEIYWINTGILIKREHQIKKILHKLEENNIEYLPLKGAALLDTSYQKIGLRLMIDVDILVKPNDFLSAIAILLANGMQPEWKYDSQDLFEFKKMPPEYWPGGLSFCNRELLRIDLHRDFVTYHWFKIAIPLEMDQVWERCIRSDDINNQWKTRLSPYDLLINLCLHLALHGLQEIKNFYDVDLFLRNLPPDWDWERFISIIKKTQLCSVTFHTFTFSQEFFRTPIPTTVLSALKPSRFDIWQVRLLITAKDILENRRRLGLRYPSLVKFALFDGSGIKLTAILNLLFPKLSWMKYNPTYHNLFAHWCHLLRVIFRGD